MWTLLISSSSYFRAILSITLDFGSKSCKVLSKCKVLVTNEKPENYNNI